MKRSLKIQALNQLIQVNELHVSIVHKIYLKNYCADYRISSVIKFSIYYFTEISLEDNTNDAVVSSSSDANIFISSETTEEIMPLTGPTVIPVSLVMPNKEVPIRIGNHSLKIQEKLMEAE